MTDKNPALGIDMVCTLDAESLYIYTAINNDLMMIWREMN